MALVSLERGRGLPGSGVLVLGGRLQADGSVVGLRFLCLAFLPLVPLGRVRLIPVPEAEGSSSLFNLVHEGPIPPHQTIKRWLLTLGLAALALGPGAYVLPRIHETGAIPGLRLIAAALALLLPIVLADLAAGRLVSRSPRG